MPIGAPEEEDRLLPKDSRLIWRGEQHDRRVWDQDLSDGVVWVLKPQWMLWQTYITRGDAPSPQPQGGEQNFL